MPSPGFEPAIPKTKQTYALDRAADEVGGSLFYDDFSVIRLYSVDDTMISE
jgi:hypothetical protein